jgi:hypothetical protein
MNILSELKLEGGPKFDSMLTPGTTANDLFTATGILLFLALMLLVRLFWNRIIQPIIARSVR